MGTQLIFCLETNEQTKSDYIYIRSTMDHFFKMNQTNIKISPVYMNGKYNYNSLKVKKKIEELTKQYSVTSNANRSVVILCVDCDDYDIKNEDKLFLKNVEIFCRDNEYRLVWFCKDIEQVFLHDRVRDNEKKKRSEDFRRKGMIEKIDIKSLEASVFQMYRSNLGNVLAEFMESKIG